MLDRGFEFCAICRSQTIEFVSKFSCCCKGSHGPWKWLAAFVTEARGDVAATNAGNSRRHIVTSNVSLAFLAKCDHQLAARGAEFSCGFQACVGGVWMAVHAHRRARVVSSLVAG